MLQYPHPSKGELQTGPGSWLKNPEFVIPNEVCEVRNLSFLGILIKEGFIAQKTCDAKSYLASLGMTRLIIQWICNSGHYMCSPAIGRIRISGQNFPRRLFFTGALAFAHAGLSDSPRAHRTLSRTRRTRRHSARRAPHGVRSQRICRLPADGIPHAQLERHAGAPSHARWRSRICLYGRRARKDAICRNRLARDQTASKTRARGACESGADSERHAVR